MSLNLPNYLSLDNFIKQQEKYNIDPFLLKEFYFILSSKNRKLINFFLKEKMKDKKIDEYLSILIELDIISQKNLLLLNTIMKENKPLKTIDNIDYKIILNHLSYYAEKKFKVTKARESLILKWIKKGYSEKDFFYVHIYYASLWKENPDFQKYLKPETLYNNKFESRVEDSKYIIDEFFKMKQVIDDILEYYKLTYQKYILNKLYIENNREKGEENNKNLINVNLDSEYNKYFIDVKKIKNANKILFWLNKGYSIDGIKKTIESSIKSWSKKEELIRYISLEKILDSKFPERFKISNKIRLERDKSVDAISDWLKKQQ